MTVRLEGSERPIPEMLETGVAFVPGFFDDDMDAIEDASELLEATLETTGEHDHLFGNISQLDPNGPLVHIANRIIGFVNSSEPVKNQELPPLPAQPGLIGRRFGPEDSIAWHRDNPFLGRWAVALAVIQGSGITQVGGTIPFFGRLRYVEIESQTSDLILLRGNMNRLHTPHTRRRSIHRARAGANGRQILSVV